MANTDIDNITTIDEMHAALIDAGYDDAEIFKRGTDEEYVRIVRGEHRLHVWYDRWADSQGWAWTTWVDDAFSSSGPLDSIEECAELLSDQTVS